ncbi:hypothetical protein [Flavobacterium sp.]|uniref:hypothetical protein n=1 Tax=Flavobacterium sp. TaxID=239 RepID=UPI00286AC9E3|nr:hypothetical protein [Flavobacterium sp.]
MEKGFYKLSGKQLIYGEWVSSKDLYLSKETKDDFTYPIDGWYYFESEAEAKEHFGIVDEKINK